MTRFALFETAIGRMGAAWRSDALVALQLPEASDDETIARLQSKAVSRAEDPPQQIDAAIASIQAHLRGEPSTLQSLAVAWEGLTPFARLVMERARLIPPGETLTYGELARLVGSPGGARAVGRVMARNPLPIVVPCHRIFGAAGRPVGFSAKGGVTLKQRLLDLERGASSDSRQTVLPTLAPGASRW